MTKEETNKQNRASDIDWPEIAAVTTTMLRLSQLYNISTDSTRTGDPDDAGASDLLRSIGLKLSGDQIDILLTNMDSDRNGSIEFDELVAAIFDDIDEQTTNQDHMLEIFQSCSIGDGNDVITKAELVAAMGQPPTYKELPKMMIGADGLVVGEWWEALSFRRRL